MPIPQAREKHLLFLLVAKQTNSPPALGTTTVWLNPDD